MATITPETIQRIVDEADRIGREHYPALSALIDEPTRRRILAEAAMRRLRADGDLDPAS